MNFNGYELFYHVKDVSLRDYNRVNTYLSVVDRHGKNVGKNYLKKFNRKDQESIFKMMIDVHKNGYEQFRRSFMRLRNA